MADGTSDLPVKARPGTEPSRISIASAWNEPISSTWWTPATVRAALDELESGTFRSAASLADSAGRDCEVFGALATRVRALSSRYALPFSVEAGSGDGRRRETIRARIEELWWTTFPEDVIEPVLADSIMLGAAVGRVWWERSKSEWVPQLVHLAPHGLEHEEWSGHWYYTTRDGQRLRVTPGDGTWFLHLPHGRRSFMRGSIRPIAEPWLARRYSARDMARWCERHGMPALKINEPHFASDDVELNAAAATVYAGIRTGMTSSAVIRLPQGQTKDDVGWDAEWLTLDGKSYEAFVEDLKRCANDINTAMLGRSASAEAKGGDGELASETRRNEFLSSDAEPLSTTIREQIWKPFVAYNYGEDDIENAAWGRWNTRPPTDRQRAAEVLEKLSTTLPALLEMGIDMEPILEEFGLKAPGGLKKPKPPPTPAPAGPAAPKPPEKEAA